MLDQPWAVDALCAQTDADIFFPDKGGSTRAAKDTCARCYVQAECLDYALRNDERFGIWGGFSERERHSLNPNHHAVACTAPGCDKRFGTDMALRAHVRLSHFETPAVTCPDCGRLFGLPSHLTMHIRAVHPDTERSVS